MPSFKPFSDVTKADVIGYMRLEEVSVSDSELLDTILEAAKAYVLQQTGRTAEEASTMPDLTIAVLALSSDMYDKRAYIVTSEVTSKVVDDILGSRSVNLL